MKIKVIARNLRHCMIYLRKEAKVEGEIMLMQVGEKLTERGELLPEYCVHISNKNKSVEAGSTITLDKYNPDMRVQQPGEVYIIA